jgi:hypothetical protein
MNKNKLFHPYLSDFFPSVFYNGHIIIKPLVHQMKFTLKKQKKLWAYGRVAVCLVILLVVVSILGMKTVGSQSLAAAVINLPPTGSFAGLDGTAIDPQLVGWAYDPNTPASSIDVDFYVGLSGGNQTFVGRVSANLPRSDINKTYNIVGNHGFIFHIPSQYKGSTRTWYAYAIDMQSPPNPLIGQPKTITVPNPTDEKTNPVPPPVNGVRTVVPPNVVRTPAAARALFYPQFTTPVGQWYGAVRWQGNDIVSTNDNYAASIETKFAPPAPISDWQFGPNKTGRRSTYQAYGDEVGAFSLSKDSPEIFAGYSNSPESASKHFAYGYTFATPRPIFQEADPWSLMLQAKITIPEFVAHNYVTTNTAGAETPFPLDLVYFVLSFKDRTNGEVRAIPWSVVIFEAPRGDQNVERIFTDPSNGLVTVTSRTSADRTNKKYTSLAKNSAVTTGTVFSDERTFRFYITPQNFLNSVSAVNVNIKAYNSTHPSSPKKLMSTVLSNYSLVSFGLLQEQALQEGDQSEAALTIKDFGYYETSPAYAAGNIQI